ncbi:MAG: TM2 domain-containing protein [Phocaeicola sp.]
MVFCKGCGKTVHESATSCPQCGFTEKPKTSKNKSTATVLCFFLGALGAHKFYMGKAGWGVVYLLFFWTLIPSLVACVEFFMLLCMSEETFHKKVTNNQ